MAPDFKLPSITGMTQSEFQLSSYRGRNVILLSKGLNPGVSETSEVPKTRLGVRACVRWTKEGASWQKPPLLLGGLLLRTHGHERAQPISETPASLFQAVDVPTHTRTTGSAAQ